MNTPNSVLTSVSQQALMFRLIKMSEGSRTHKTEEMVNGKREVVENTIKLPPAPTYPLAANVQERNIERLARRWGA